MECEKEKITEVLERNALHYFHLQLIFDLNISLWLRQSMKYLLIGYTYKLHHRIYEHTQVGEKQREREKISKRNKCHK